MQLFIQKVNRFFACSECESLRIVPMEEIETLEPTDVAKRVVQVYFHHHLLPLKLVIFSNGNKHPIKLQPDIGYFIKPQAMDLTLFMNLERQLRGMFEYSRRFMISSSFTIFEW